MSTLIDAEIVNVLVLAAVLEADLGSHRKITRFRLLRPLLLAALVVPLFLEKVTTHGGGLSVQLAGVAAGAYTRVAEAVDQVIREKEVVEPDAQLAASYASQSKQYRRLCAALKMLRDVNSRAQSEEEK